MEYERGAARDKAGQRCVGCKEGDFSIQQSGPKPNVFRHYTLLMLIRQSVSY